MGFEWNMSQRFLHMLGRDALKIFQRNLRHWEIGRSEVQDTLRAIESTGTSNPKLPRSFRRGGEPSFKDWQVLDGWKVEIAPRAWVEMRRREEAAAAVKREEVTVYPDPLHGIYARKLPPGVSSRRARVSGQSGKSRPWAGDSCSPWLRKDMADFELDLDEMKRIDIERSNGVRDITWLEISQQSIKENNDLKQVKWRSKPFIKQISQFVKVFQDLFILRNN